MSKSRKRLDKMRFSRTNVSFDDIKCVALAHGCRVIQSRGSHSQIIHPDLTDPRDPATQVTISVHGNQVRPYQVDQFVTFIDRVQQELVGGDE
ncbi:MAG TPA: hypothetical protein DCL63_10185 [Firmicutes bacterium]|nr:hypothetical protein [Bacillota bacterium]